MSSERAAVLIVEDEWLLRWRAREIVERAGYEVFEAADADEALAILCQTPNIEALFTDINMPGSLDGLDLARRVHQLYPHIRLLLTSGKVALTKEQIPDDGVFLPKPYSSASVERQLSHFLD